MHFKCFKNNSSNCQTDLQFHFQVVEANCESRSCGLVGDGVIYRGVEEGNYF